MESLGILFAAAAWAVPLTCLLTLTGAVTAVVGATRWRRRTISALERAENEQAAPRTVIPNLPAGPGLPDDGSAPA